MDYCRIGLSFPYFVDTRYPYIKYVSRSLRGIFWRLLLLTIEKKWGPKTWMIFSLCQVKIDKEVDFQFLMFFYWGSIEKQSIAIKCAIRRPNRLLTLAYNHFLWLLFNRGLWIKSFTLVTNLYFSKFWVKQNTAAYE